MARKSITSATVVPTVSGEINEYAKPEQQSVVVEAPDKDNGEAPQNSNDNFEVTSPVFTSIDDDKPEQKSSPSKPVPLPISQSIPVNVQMTDEGSFRIVNNYGALATTFKQLQPFCRDPNGKYPADTTCVSCHEAKPTSVFFPCQHLCVCNACIEINDMSPDCSMNLERCVCPVCSQDIGLILPHTGTEEDSYWKWVLATKPCLPAEFMKDFKNAGAKISNRSFVETRFSASGQLNGTEEHSRTSSPPKRRRSCAPSIARKSSTYELDASRKRESCFIL